MIQYLASSAGMVQPTRIVSYDCAASETSVEPATTRASGNLLDM